MKVPKDGDAVPDDHPVLRLPKPPPDFEPENYAPSADFFVLSQEERDGNGRLSVWDERRTSAEQARAFRRAEAAIVLRGRCGAIIEAGSACQKPVLVVYEPLAPPLDQKMGAEGHAGILGLRRPSGATKKEYRSLREAIADCFDIA